MQTSTQLQTPPFVAPPKLRAGSSDSRPTFLRDKFNTDGMTGHAKSARDHCRWASDAGCAPQEVLISVKRPHHTNSTWGDAMRAVESAAYACKFAAERKVEKDRLKCL